jgi:hypothetical protein
MDIREGDDEMSELKGRCFCGAVEVQLVGEPMAMGFCHCASCRQWSAGPVNAFTLWKRSAVTVTRGAHKLAEYNKTDKSYRKWCTSCGGHVLIGHPMWDAVDIPAAILVEFPFKPGVHVNYSETVMPMRDGLPKLADFPSEMGGSGTTLAE